MKWFFNNEVFRVLLQWSIALMLGFGIPWTMFEMYLSYWDELSTDIWVPKYI